MDIYTFMLFQVRKIFMGLEIRGCYAVGYKSAIKMTTLGSTVLNVKLISGRVGALNIVTVHMNKNTPKYIQLQSI